MTTMPPLLTVKDWEALPDDGKYYWLIRGRLREFPGNEMTRRNRSHTKLEARISQFIGVWLDARPEPRGEVHAGDVGVLLGNEPDTSVGIDVAYFTADVIAAQTDESSMYVGVPALAVEILSPSTPEEDTNEKLETYKAAGVPLVWLVDPYLRTVTVLRPDEPPVMLNVRDTLTAEPHLPGFAVPVARLFSRP